MKECKSNSNNVRIEVEIVDDDNPDVSCLSCLFQVIDAFKDKLSPPQIELITKWVHESYDLR